MKYYNIYQILELESITTGKKLIGLSSIDELFTKLPEQLQKYKKYFEKVETKKGIQFFIQKWIVDFYIKNKTFPKVNVDNINFEEDKLNYFEYSSEMFAYIKIPQNLLSGLARYAKLTGNNYQTEQILETALKEFMEKDQDRRYLFSKIDYVETENLKKYFDKKKERGI